MSHPISYVDYACGHSSPVRGSGGTTSRQCPACVEGYVPEPRPNYHDSPMAKYLCLCDEHTAHGSPYCDCDMCQSRIP